MRVDLAKAQAEQTAPAAKGDRARRGRLGSAEGRGPATFRLRTDHSQLGRAVLFCSLAAKRNSSTTDDVPGRRLRAEQLTGKFDRLGPWRGRSGTRYGAAFLGRATTQWSAACIKYFAGGTEVKVNLDRFAVVTSVIDEHPGVG